MAGGAFLLFMLSAGPVFSANHAQNEKITLDLKNVTLEEVFTAIKEQSDFTFWYSDNELDVNRQVSIRVTGEAISKVLDQLLQGEKLSYTVKDKHIIIHKTVAQPEPGSVAQQDQGFPVKGVVNDASGEPVIGASVVVKGVRTMGVMTDVDGKFALNVPAGAVLVVSYIGYTSKEVTPEAGKLLTVTLTENVEKLKEVVVVGYGVQKKVNLTGAVSQIDDKALENRPVTNVGQALEGTIANLNVTPSSGEPGAGMNYNIRGAATLSTRTYNSAPFFIVDGVPVDNIENINPSDIQSISVLKDAASAAIYGARAAYGVILVTTKKGSKDQKVSITYNNMFGFRSATRVPDQVNSLEFANAYNIASINSGQSPYFSDEHIARIKAYMEDPEHTPSNIPDPNNPDRWAYASLENDNVDWYRAIFKGSSFSHKHDLSVSGGSDRITYYAGAGYYRENGLLRYGDEKFERYNIASNVHFEPYSWLRGDVRVRFSRSEKDVPAIAHNNAIGSWMHFASTRFPNWALKDPNGHWSAASEMPRQWEGRSPSSSNMVSITGAFEAEPVKDWKLNVDYTYRNTSDKTEDQQFPFIVEYTISELPIRKTDNYFYAEMTQTDYTSANFYTSYQKEIGGHFFEALVGQQFDLNKYNAVSARRRDMITTDIPSFGVATGEQTVGGIKQHWANTGTFMRANYNYKEKYLVEFNARYDGSSKFRRGKRFGFFPSVSVGYNLAREDFWPLKDWVGMFKVRGSYGSLGNQDVPNYLYLSTMGLAGGNYIINGILPKVLQAPGLVSEDLTWETAKTLNFGFDAALLNNRLLVSLDAYRRKTTDMFGPADALPATLGAEVPKRNNADLLTKGFELNIGWRDKVGKVSYNASIVLGNSSSKLSRFNNPTGLLSTYYEGQVLGEIWGYTTKGIIQTQEQLDQMPDQSFIHGNWTLGDIEYKDLNGDHVINNGKNTKTDHGDLSVIGNADPKYTFGINLGASWNGFDISAFLQGVGKRDFAPPYGGNGSGVFFWGFTGGFGSNLYKESMDFWTPDNTGAYLPKPYTSGEVVKNQQIQTRYLQNAAYIRLKNLQIGYTIPASVMKSIGLNRIRAFVSGENLLTLTSLPDNYDPEFIGDGKVYPMMKTVSFGINVGF